MKDIYVIYGTINSGKTHTMWLVLAHLLEQGATLSEPLFNAKEPYSREYILSHEEQLPDFRAYVDFNGRTIMLLSAAELLNDDYWGVKGKIEEAIEKGVDYIVCCSRSQNREGSVYRYLLENYRGSMLPDDNWYWVGSKNENVEWLKERDYIASQLTNKLLDEIKSQKDTIASEIIEIKNALFNIYFDLNDVNIPEVSRLLLKLLGDHERASLLQTAGLTNMRFLDTALPLGGISGYYMNTSNCQVTNAPQMPLLYKVILPNQPVILKPLYLKDDLVEENLVKQSVTIPYDDWYNVNRVFVSSVMTLCRKELLQVIADCKDNDDLETRYKELQTESGIIRDNELLAFSENPLYVSAFEILHEVVESLRIEGITNGTTEIELRRLINIQQSLFVQSISIKNYKLYSNDQEPIVFKDGFTVLIGDNATGKTTVLDALRIALTTLLPPRIGDDTRAIDYGIDDIFYLSSVHREIQQDGGMIYSWPVEVTAESVYSQLKRERYSRDNRATRNINKAAEAQFKQVAANPNSQERLPLIVYCGVERTRPMEKKKVEEKLRYDRFDGYLNCLNTRSTTSFLKSWLRNLQQNATTNNIDRERLESFIDAVCGCLKDERIVGFKYVYSEKKANDGKIDRIDDVILERKVSENKTERELLSNMSAGYKVMVGLIADLAYRCIVLNPHLGKDAITGTSGIVLIDEIDMHLHPLWQRHIVDDLKRCFPKIQFIATTHSPFVVQSLDAGQIINLNNRPIMHNPQNSNLAVNALYMGVESDRSIRFQEDEEDAYDFLTALKGENISSEEIDKIMKSYAIRHSDNPIYVAKLKIEAGMAKNEVLYKEFIKTEEKHATDR